MTNLENCNVVSSRQLEIHHFFPTAYIKKQFGDFSLRKNLILRFKKGDTNYFYSGLQIFNTDIFKNFDQKKFSFNIVWDYLIDKKILRGKIMHSNWYHVGDIQGLNVVKKLQS